MRKFFSKVVKFNLINLKILDENCKKKEEIKKGKIKTRKLQQKIHPRRNKIEN